MADIILDLAETYMFTPYFWGVNSSVPKDLFIRQFTTLFIFTNIGAALMYLSFSGFAYLFLFDKRVLKDRRILPNQVRREIMYTLSSIPLMSFLTVFMFMAEVRGYSKLYDNVSDFGTPYFIASIFLFILFSDMLIYFIHRGLHDVKFLYRLHKPHHTWIITTPFASHAFHPLDGFAQGFPYHLFPFFFPFHKYLYLGMFIIVQLWTVSIHDCNFLTPAWLENYVNGAEHHTLHHTRYSYNYGQYFTFWDRLFGTHLNPLEHHDLVIKEKDA